MGSTSVSVCRIYDVICNNMIYMGIYRDVESVLLYYKWEMYIIMVLTPWSRVLLEKLTGFQPEKKFPAFHGTRRFITAFTSACYRSLS
jgi:hypothetical protein